MPGDQHGSSPDPTDPFESADPLPASVPDTVHEPDPPSESASPSEPDPPAQLSGAAPHSESEPPDPPAQLSGSDPPPEPGAAAVPLRLRTPADLLAALPYLVDHPLDDAVVALVLGGGSVQGVLHGGLDHLDHVLTPDRSGGAAVDAALAAGGTAVLVAGFGQPERITPHVHALLREARARGLPVLEALRVTGDRYWSYLCRDPACCPAEGKRFDPDTSRIPAEAVLRGMVPGGRIDSARIRFLLDPVRGAPREAVAEAAAAEEERREDAGTAAADRWIPEVLDVLREEERRRVTEPGTLARLGVHLTELRVRDAVWARITPETARLHVRLWSRVVRHVPERHRPAPAALLGVAAWQHDDQGLARAALDVSLAADPHYAMAVLMTRALQWGLPAERWRGFAAERLDGRGEEEAEPEGESDPSRPVRM
ncbi:DUF4192 domain-containing protein [Nocardiopsis ganjiahuensis]|uniref:DUF4192 domain-containing protein n=1 Tax=Nocardiopsis ganjiahuensis TaxID=239984 RepID=UPI0003488224|nr:DUF4192 domain-containing protein [Nocardiopsis ganjiahuensis]